jgi:hypothetical protein
MKYRCAYLQDSKTKVQYWQEWEEIQAGVGVTLGSLDHNEFAHKSTMEYFSQRRADVREHNVSNDRYSKTGLPSDLYLLTLRAFSPSSPVPIVDTVFISVSWGLTVVLVNSSLLCLRLYSTLSLFPLCSLFLCCSFFNLENVAMPSPIAVAEKTLPITRIVRWLFFIGDT